MEKKEEGLSQKIEEKKGRAYSCARAYCGEIAKSVYNAPLMLGDLERAFVAGYESGTMDGLSADELMEAVERMKKTFVDIMSDS